MRTEMLMPQMGESIAEATIIKWLKNVGDVVNKDETILEISTDKVDSEIPSPASGKLVEILAEPGQTVAVKSIIAVIDSDAAAETKKPAAKTESKPAPAASPAPQAAQAPAAAKSTPAPQDSRVYSPLVRSIASQHGLSTEDLAHVPGSGAQGRVTKEDLMSFLENKSSASGASTSAPAPAKSKSDLPSGMPRPNFDQEGVRVEPFDNMRKLIAEHMVRSKHTSPHVYSMTEVDVTNIGKWRKREQAEFQSREGFNLSYTPFFLEAVVKALNAFPRMNSSVDGESIVYKRDINLGCAVALGEGGLDGLIVPVIKNAGSLNFVGIARGLNDLAQRARSKKLRPDDVQGGTFTVTNPGVFGNIMGCPIISQPQVAILALGAIKKRVVVIDDAIAIRDMIILTMSYDHRIIDGALSGHFLNYIQKYLEGWNMERTV